MRTLIVNAFGGPGVGKTTFAWEIASLLKKLDLLVEYVPEYAKELVYEERFDILDNTMVHQKMIMDEQKKRIDRLMGKVRIIVTDSPILLSATYAKDADEKFIQESIDIFNQYTNLNFYIKRNKEDNYVQAGRKETLEQAIKEDNNIYNFLNDNHIHFNTYNRLDMGIIIDKIVFELDDIFDIGDIKC